MFEFKKFCDTTSESHAQNVCKKMSQKGLQVTYDKKTFTVYLVRLATPKTEHPLMYVKGQKRQYYRV
jgi:hypothetical protein